MSRCRRQEKRSTQVRAAARCERGHKGGNAIQSLVLAAFRPLANSAVYAATKGFVLRFSEALWLELASQNIHVLGVCPGPVATHFFERIGSTPPAGAITAQQVASETLRAFDLKKPVLVPGRWVTSLQPMIYRLLPRTMMARSAAKISRDVMMQGKK
jgi:uncharacterized protein